MDQDSLEQILLAVNSFGDCSKNYFWSWESWGSWEALSNIVLIVTLVVLVFYTRATQKMEKEMIRQRVFDSAQEINFKMTGNYYEENLEQRPDCTTFAKLITPKTKDSVCQFNILGENGETLGRCTDFSELVHRDIELHSNYFMQPEGRKLFISQLKSRDGIFQAKVLTTNGNEFIYSFKALNKNWEKDEKEVGRFNDVFILIKKYWDS